MNQVDLSSLSHYGTAHQNALLISGFKGKITHYKDQCTKRAEHAPQLSLRKLAADFSGCWISKVFNHMKVRSFTPTQNPRDGGLWYAGSYFCYQRFCLQLPPKFCFEYLMQTSNKTSPVEWKQNTRF